MVVVQSDGGYSKTPPKIKSGENFTRLHGWHSWIGFKNTSKSNVKLGDIIVVPGEEVTVGVWGNMSKANHKGVFYNLESMGTNISGGFQSYISYTRHIDLNQVNRLNKFITSNNDYHYVKFNCATFAIGAWNSAFPNKSDRVKHELTDTPKSLYNGIQFKKFVRYNKPIVDSNFAYYKSKGILNIKSKMFMLG